MRVGRLVLYLGQALLLAVACLYPLVPNWLDRRLPATHEGYRYLLLSDWFRDAMAAGNWYPRWLPEMNGGFGYPQFVFYQPGYFFLNAAASLLVEPLFMRQLLTLSIIALLGGCGVYLLARRFTSPGYALLLVLLFQMAPYVHTNLFLRGDLSEWMALELMPWPVYFLLQFFRAVEEGLVRQRLYSWLGLTLATACLCYCHPVALMFLPLLLLFIGAACLVKGTSAGSFAAWGELAGGVALGVALSLPYWLPVMQMKPYVNVAAALDGFVAWKNTVAFRQLLFGSLLGGDDAKEFLGAPFVVFALVGGWYGRKQPFVFGCGLAYLAILLLITPISQLFWRLYPFSLLQFPWRLAVFAPLLQVICFLGFVQSPFAGSGRVIARVGQIGGLCLLIGWTFHGHAGFTPALISGFRAGFSQETLACLRNFAQTGKPLSYASTIDAGEWLPLAAKSIGSEPARGTTRSGCEETRQAMGLIAVQLGMPELFLARSVPRPLLEVSRTDWTVCPHASQTPFRLESRLSGPVAAELRINQLYLPGWRVELGGHPVPRLTLERSLLPDGRIRLFLPPGEWHLRAWYAGPPGWWLRNLLLALLSAVAAIYWSYRWHVGGKADKP